jgi:glycosyltransferase involved in cell wall biosynthesis
MRILLVEPYFTGSHRAWAEGYRDHSAHEVVLVTHEGRFWKWRMHGGYLTLAEEIARLGGRFDAVLASDMVHLPALLGAARSDLAGVPVVLYMHENQLMHPVAETDREDLAYPIINWGSMAVADRVVFNSSFHRDGWFAAVRGLLRHFPDRTHVHRVPEVEARSVVLPVGVDLKRLDGVPVAPADDAAPMILWNQRWEFDKGPAEFFAALERLAEGGVPFRVALAGENVRQHPAEFEEARERLGDRVVQFGYAPEDEYRGLLAGAAVVVSTAHHEFFGISVVEAIYTGAFPVLPRRLVYLERIPPEFHDACLYDDAAGLVDRIAWALEHGSEAARLAAAMRPAVAGFDWSVIAPAYDALLGSLA